MKFARGIVKMRFFILIATLLVMIPCIFGYIHTRINFDMLSYLPEDMDTVVGQKELLDDFGTGDFAMLVVEGMSTDDALELKSDILEIDHVDDVIWYDSILSKDVPIEIIPDEIYKEFNSEDSTMMAVFFDSPASSDETMKAIREVRSVAGRQCFASGLTAMVVDLKDLCEHEEPIIIALAVILSCAAMMLLLDGWLVPLIFILSIGFMIIINLGTNYFLGEISFITKALSAVLQLAVTMDYSIFLWHSYNDYRDEMPDHKEAMAKAIRETFSSVLGSSITTFAGFVALCFMTYTMGLDLGIVMAKGVLLGVIGSVTVLPALILLFDRPLNRSRHKSLIPNMDKFALKITKIFPVFIVIFVLLIPPAFDAYRKTNNEVYYDLQLSLPDDMEFAVANKKLSEEFNVRTTHMVLLKNGVRPDDIRAMIKEMNDVDGVKFVLGLESVLGSRIPLEMIPDDIIELLKSDKWELMLIPSEYKVGTDASNAQVTRLNDILKKYNDEGMLIGEGPCMKDMIETTDHDFKVVNIISIIAIFLIIAAVQSSLSLPFILVAIIELAIFINLGITHYTGVSLPFIAPICISTIQLGATVDYAILMTTKYKRNRISGSGKREAVSNALSSSIPSVLVSGIGLFAATFGVAVYSDVDMICSVCMLLARGAIISMLCVILLLPALLMLCDRVICFTTRGMKKAINFRENGGNGSAGSSVTEEMQ